MVISGIFRELGQGLKTKCLLCSWC